MADTFYKAYERRVCRAFGGNRRGADYGGKAGGKNDCTGTVGFSVEIKCWERPTFKAIEEDLKKAEARRQYKCDIPVSVMKRKGAADADGIVSIRFDIFMKEIFPLLKEKKILQQLGFD